MGADAKTPAKRPAAPPKQSPAGEDADDEGEGSAPEYVTSEQLNAAITKAFKRFGTKTLPGIMEKAVATALARTPEEDEEDEDGENDAPDAAAKTKPASVPAGVKAAPEETPGKPSPEARKLAKLQKEMEALRTEREAEKARAAATEARAALTDALATAGVRKEMVLPLAAFLQSEEGGKAVRRNAEGVLVFVARDSDGEEEEQGLRDGIKGFLATDAGKAYLAPRGAGGSGNTGAGQGAGRSAGNGQPSKQDLDTELMRAVLGLTGSSMG